MLRDLASALFDPRGFFDALRTRAPSAGRAFVALLVPACLGALVQLTRADMLLALAPPFARELPPQVLRTAFYVGTLSAGPIAALVHWFVGWLPLRIGAGRFVRLGEVAAWTQLPAAVTSLIGQALAVAGVVALPLAVGLQVASVLWCGWLVYAGLRAFAPARLRGGLVAYGLFALGAFALGVAGLFGNAASPAPDGLVF